ncbi:MAG TPA: hypothetical protein VJV21_08050 [Pyrinomonadaceae bacterium]|nr:hypothetical protein [Pyrinomonadaceae bacterium]
MFPPLLTQRATHDAKELQDSFALHVHELAQINGVAREGTVCTMLVVFKPVNTDSHLNNKHERLPTADVGRVPYRFVSYLSYSLKRVWRLKRQLERFVNVSYRILLKIESLKQPVDDQIRTAAQRWIMIGFVPMDCRLRVADDVESRTDHAPAPFVRKQLWLAWRAADQARIVSSARRMVAIGSSPSSLASCTSKGSTMMLLGSAQRPLV